MKTTILLAAISATFVLAEDAPITQDNPSMASIQANLQSSKDVQGTITGVSNDNGTGVNFNINFFSFPSSGSPFNYYIANDALSSDGTDCSTLSTTPFNPYSADTSGTCNTAAPATCPIGGLSEKHGKMNINAGTTSFQKFYLDLYLSTEAGTEAYFGEKAIVITDITGKVLNCANFIGSGTGSSATSGAASSAMASATSSMSAAQSSASAAASSAASTASAAASSAASSASAAATSAAPTGAAVLQKIVSGGAVVAAIAVFAL